MPMTDMNLMSWSGLAAMVGGVYFSFACFFFFSSRRRHTRFDCDWSSDVCSSDLFLWPGTPVQASTVRESILANGMKVLLVEVPKAPVVTVQIWYRVGSRNEVMGRAGLSHMLEHMMFKGTERYPKGTFSRTIRKNGGNDNAFTSQDYTAYFENLA